MIALASGVMSLMPMVGWPRDSLGYEIAVITILFVATLLWVWVLFRLAGDVLAGLLWNITCANAST